METSRPLPLPTLIALLRVVRRKPAGPFDEDYLFDEFGCFGNEQVIARAAAKLCNDGGNERRGEDVKGRIARLDAVLVDMLRTHKLERDMKREAV